MNEIEKLYENAGIYRCNMPDIDCNHNCNKCEDYNSFTAEKQLELIKWLIIEGYIEDMLTVQISEENFEVCLADTFNELWQDLTEEEKEQIRSVLNG